MTAPFKSPVPDLFVAEDVTFFSGVHRLRGQVFRPGTRPKAVAVLHGATGVPARFYEAFARWLAQEKGIACLTYDYRDFGASLDQPLGASEAEMSDWGVHDQQAARDFVANAFPGTPLWVIGHSLGGFCLPFQRNLDQIDRVITVASGLVHVRDHPWPYQALARFFWFGPVPLITWVMGYMPGKALRIGANIPAGVYWQWRRWCTRRDFFSPDFGGDLPFPDWAGVTARVKFVAISDDELTPPKTIWKAMQCYPSAAKTQITVTPSDAGVETLGHLNVFTEKARAAWEMIVA
ncbi:MAG: alpha/beta fold hydrolase [Pseudomonadota bacterium]